MKKKKKKKKNTQLKKKKVEMHFEELRPADQGFNRLLQSLKEQLIYNVPHTQSERKREQNKSQF